MKTKHLLLGLFMLSAGMTQSAHAKDKKAKEPEGELRLPNAGHVISRDNSMYYVTTVTEVGPKKDVMRIESTNVQSPDQKLDSTEIISKDIIYQNKDGSGTIVVRTTVDSKTKQETHYFGVFGKEDAAGMAIIDSAYNKRHKNMKPYNKLDDKINGKKMSGFGQTIANLDTFVMKYGATGVLTCLEDQKAENAKVIVIAAKDYKGEPKEKLDVQGVQFVKGVLREAGHPVFSKSCTTLYQMLEEAKEQHAVIQNQEFMDLYNQDIEHSNKALIGKIIVCSNGNDLQTAIITGRDKDGIALRTFDAKTGEMFNGHIVPNGKEFLVDVAKMSDPDLLCDMVVELPTIAYFADWEAQQTQEQQQQNAPAKDWRQKSPLKVGGGGPK